MLNNIQKRKAPISYKVVISISPSFDPIKILFRGSLLLSKRSILAKGIRNRGQNDVSRMVCYIYVVTK
jgi:hypothetical protein